MNRRELISRTASIMREAGARKNVTYPKQYFTITDEMGATKKFSTSGGEKNVMYTVDDVECMLDACMNAIEEALRQGETISVKNFGEFKLAYRPGKNVLDINKRSGTIYVPPRYVPKFVFGNRLRMAAQTYTSTLDDQKAIESFPTEAELLKTDTAEE